MIQTAFDLDQVLLSLPSPEGVLDHWRIRDACEGTQIFGTTGSGKTSGSGQAIAKAFLSQGFGGLVLCAKVDERELWQRYAEEMGRGDDLVIFGPGHPYRFNFLDYEYSRDDAGGALTENVAQLFNRALEMTEGAQGSASDPYWQRAQMQMLRNAIDLLGARGTGISLADLQKVITSAPTQPEEHFIEEWQENSFLHQTAMAVDARGDTMSEQQHRDFEFALDYWLNEFPAMDSRPRSSIVSGFTSMADGLKRGLMYDLFCTSTDLKPDWSEEGAIILLDLSTKRFGHVGVVAQGIFKYLWQQAIERRDVARSPLPVFLWADESQFFINRYDMEFQTTARSSRACTVYLTQNISNYYARLGGNAKAAVDSLLGNFQTKLFHTNGDAVTNEWASEQISKSFHTITSGGGQTGSNQSSYGFSQQLHYEVQPAEFLTLRNGGPDNDLEVDAILFKPGRIWEASGRPHRHVTFSQII